MTNNELSNADIALYALYKLGGATKKIHTEYIAVEAYKLSEERFSWIIPEFRKRGYPDKTAVRYALETAVKRKFIKGRAGRDKGGPESEGWQFTPLGVEWFLKNEGRIKNYLNIEIPISTAMPKHQAERFIRKMKAEKLFKLFEANNNLDSSSIYDFTDMLSCSPNSSKEVLRKKFDILKSTALSINDDEIKLFLGMCEDTFKESLAS